MDNDKLLGCPRGWAHSSCCRPSKGMTSLLLPHLLTTWWRLEEEEVGTSPAWPGRHAHWQHTNTMRWHCSQSRLQNQMAYAQLSERVFAKIYSNATIGNRWFLKMKLVIRLWLHYKEIFKKFPRDSKGTHKHKKLIYSSLLLLNNQIIEAPALLGHLKIHIGNVYISIMTNTINNCQDYSWITEHFLVVLDTITST